jgi:hypothetical protein
MPPSRLLRQCGPQERLGKAGSEPMPMSSDEFAKYFP